MRSQLLYRPMTVEEFLEIDFGWDRKYELVDGELRIMTGGTPAHPRVACNILTFLVSRLRGTGCRAYHSDMGVRVSDIDAWYPDVSIFCGNPATPEREQERIFGDPVAVFEVLSPSTRKGDTNRKLAGHRRVPSVDTIVFVDTDAERVRIVQWTGAETWRDDREMRDQDVALPAFGLVLPRSEMFARD